LTGPAKAVPLLQSPLNCRLDEFFRSLLGHALHQYA
jgi:hypothetical protein